MPIPATATATSALGPSSLFLLSPAPAVPPPAALARPPVVLPMRVLAPGRRVSCQVALSADVSSSAAEVEEEERQASAKIGKRVRVKGPLKIYHVQKAPDLDLGGLEGVIKQYVGVWKGKRISANLPYKVEFQISAENQPRPVKFVAHLKEDEFEYLPSSE